MIGLGGNIPSHIGSPRDTMKRALLLLQKLPLEVTKVSSVYQTAPVPASGQPDFLNIAVSAETQLSAQELLDAFQRIEVGCGRKPAERWSARTMDIDLLAYGAEVLPSNRSWQSVVDDKDPAAFLEEPVIPHPRLHKRAFVLIPLLDITPKWRHPVLNMSVEELANREHIKAEGRDVVLISPIL
ncbi:MAG: 2-amino-4-hydroxy-6-hydroxymethyldihydropteridine diphosphokinase [Kordiimonas sp.]